MKKLCKTVKDSFLQLLYPQKCLYCDQLTERLFLCEHCLKLVELIDPTTCCSTCFSLEEKCFFCAVNKPSIIYAAVFENIGPMQVIDHHLQHSFHKKLAKLAASYMIIQLDHLNWGTFDYIISDRQAFYHSNSMFILAKEVSKYLEIPILTRRKKIHAKKILYVGNKINKSYLESNQLFQISLCRLS